MTSSSTLRLAGILLTLLLSNTGCDDKGRGGEPSVAPENGDMDGGGGQPGSDTQENGDVDGGGGQPGSDTPENGDVDGGGGQPGPDNAPPDSDSGPPEAPEQDKIPAYTIPADYEPPVWRREPTDVPYFEGLKIFPENVRLPIGTSMTFRTHLHSGGGILEISFRSAWKVSAPGIVDVAVDAVSCDERFEPNSTCLGEVTITGKAVGTLELAAQLYGAEVPYGPDLPQKERGITRITVTDDRVESITVSPAKVSALLGGRAQYKAEVKFADGTSLDATNVVEWNTTDPRVEISNEPGTRGSARSFVLGGAEVKATYGGVTGSAQFKIDDSNTKIDYVLIPENAVARVNQTIRYILETHYPGGFVQQNSDARFATSNFEVASAGGSVFCRGTGTVTVTDAYSLGATTQLTCRHERVEVSPVRLTPSDATISVGEEILYKCATLSNDGLMGESFDVRSSHANIASAKELGSTRMVGRSPGSLSISCHVDGREIQTSLTVK
jgi:hypothetical protein